MLGLAPKLTLTRFIDSKTYALMSLYNTIHDITVTCPRCKRTGDMEVDLYFGYRQMIDYKLGDSYQWWPDGRPVEDGGRPPGGNLDGEGYTECPNCKKDFFVIVHVRDDKIVGVEPDLATESRAAQALAVPAAGDYDGPPQ